MLCLAGKLGLMDWTLVPGLCTAGGRPLGEWALGSGRSPGLRPLLLSRSRSASVLHLPVGGCLSVCPPSLEPGRRVISRGRAVWPAGLRATSRRHAALSQPGSTLGPWPSGHRPPGAAAGGWLAACAGSPGERGPAATIKAERGRDRDRDGGGHRQRELLSSGAGVWRERWGTVPGTPAMSQPAARPDSPGRLRVCPGRTGSAGRHLGESRGRPTGAAGPWVVVGTAGAGGAPSAA